MGVTQWVGAVYEINFLNADPHSWRLTADNSQRFEVSVETGAQGGIRFRGTGQNKSGSNWEGAFLQFTGEEGGPGSLSLPVGGIAVVEWEWRAQNIQSQATWLQVGLFKLQKPAIEGQDPVTGRGYQAVFSVDTSSDPVEMRVGVQCANWTDSLENHTAVKAPEGWGRDQTRTLRLYLERTKSRELWMRLQDVTAGVQLLAEQRLSGDFPEELDTLLVAMRRTYAAGGTLDRFTRFAVKSYPEVNLTVSSHVLRTGAVRLEWEFDDRYSAEELYSIYRREGDSGKIEQIGMLKGRKFIDRNTLPDQNYEYRVVVHDLEGNQAGVSETVHARVEGVVETLPLRYATAIKREQGLELKWDVPEEMRASRVRVYEEGTGTLLGEYPVSDQQGLLKDYQQEGEVGLALVSPEGKEQPRLTVQITGWIPQSPHAGKEWRHPFLLLSQEEVDNIKERIEVDPQYRRFYEKGVKVDTDKAWKHLSEVVGKLPRERTGKHSSICTSIQQLAIGYVFTGRQEYAQLVKSLLLEYADFYSSIPIVRPWADGHLTSQTLNESMLFLNLIWAYDLTYSTFTENERQIVEQQLFRKAVESINRRDRGKSNWQTWHNAATAAIGFVLKDPEIWKPTLNGPRGFMYHLEESVQPDGIWYEQSMAYHYFTIHSLTLLAEIAYRQGYDLYSAKVGDRHFKLLFDGPFYHAMSDLAQPPFGDSDPGQSLVAPWVVWNYAFAYKHYQDPNYLWLWDLSNIMMRRPAGTRMAPLLCLPYLEDRPAKVDEFSIESGRPLPGVTNIGGNSLLQVVGMAVMRGSRDEPSPEAAIIWKPEGTVAGHQHPNNLGIFWQTPAHRWISSSGKWASYGSDIHLGWVKHTLSDNTLVVDRQSQYPAYDGASSWRKDDPGKPSSGVLRAFVASRDFIFAEVETDNVYDGVKISRRLYNTNDYTLDVMTARSETPRTYDWVVHISGDMEASNQILVPREEVLAEGAGYSFLKDLKQTAIDGKWDTSWHAPSVKERLHVTSLTGEGWKGYVAKGPWARGQERSALMVSSHEQEVSFVTALRGVTDEDPIQELKWKEDEGSYKQGAVQVEHSRGTDYLFWSNQSCEHIGENAAFHGRNVLLRINLQGEIQIGVLTGSHYAEMRGLRLDMEVESNWSVEWLDDEAFILTYQDVWPNQVRLNTAELWTVHRLDQQAQPQEQLEAEAADGEAPAWRIEPGKEYLFRKSDPLKEYPLQPMAKPFHYQP